MRGLVNNGLVCATNSVLQCLYATQEYRDTLSHEKYNTNNGTVPGELHRLFRALANQTSDSACDSMPCVIALVTCMYATPQVGVMDDADTVFKCSLVALADAGDPACKELSELWMIKKKEKFTCSQCKTERVMNTVASDITVNPTQEPLTCLQEYMNTYSESYTVTDCYCNVCKRDTELSVVTTFVELPRLLCVKIARVRTSTRDKSVTVYRNTANVRFAARLCCNNLLANAQYELYAVVLHTGDPVTGHYSAIVKSDQTWMYVSDSFVRPMGMHFSFDKIGTTAYMVLYRRTPQ
ncbi:putative ubiquitin carboxyl-terminal hydrolase 41 [Nothobranchius furzeri]|nr:putative ubiquitin carboxyl-terminal hydrolase 41 [Nothobranchius furzeri]XP_054592928.1 putative ubiquitin carboxyl-terminal hydrolase 41 [Nothobranchius furzeri]